MAKQVADTVYDGALAQIQTARRVHMLSGEATTLAAVLSQSLGSIAVASADLVIANGDTSGRKVTLGALSSVPVTASGTFDHLALVSSTAFLCVTTHPATAINSGDTRNLNAVDILEILDPT